MTKVRYGKKAGAFALSLMTLLALSIPLGSVALANHPESCLDVEPEEGTQAVGGTHSMTATLRESADSSGPPTFPEPTQCETQPEVTANSGAVKISFEITGANDPDSGNTPDTPDGFCNILQDNSSCQFQYPANNVGDDTIRGWIDEDGQSPPNGETEADTDEPPGGDPHNPPLSPSDEPDETDVVTRTTTAGPLQNLDCDDANGPDTERETNPSNQGSASNEIYTCTVRDAQGNAITSVNTEVFGENETTINDPESPEGASYNTPDYTCNTDEDGSGNGTTNDGVCTITVTQADAETGTAEICFWAGNQGDGSSLCANEPTGESQAADGSDTGNDLADQVEKTWETQAPPEAERLDCEPEQDENPRNSSHTITCTATDAEGGRLEGEQIRAEAFGANDPDDGDSPATPDFQCQTQAEDPTTPTVTEGGTCSFTHGPGGTGTSDEPGTTTYRAWIESDGQAGDAEADRAEGQRAVEDDPGTGDPQPGTTAEPDDTDVVQKTWLQESAAGDAVLDCEPETDGNPTNTAHEITCTVEDQDGNLQENVNVDVEATGANDPDGTNSQTSPDFTCTTSEDDQLTPLTDEGGVCSFTHGPEGTSAAGTTTYRAWVDEDGDDGTDEADDAEGRDEETTPGDVVEPDGTDVVEKVWEARAATGLDAEPESDANDLGEPHTITGYVFDQVGDPLSGNTTISFEFFQGSPSDPSNGTDGNSPSSPDRTCTTNDASTPDPSSCSVTYTQTATAGTDRVCAWIDELPAMTGNNNNGTCDGEDRTEADDATNEPDRPSPADDDQDVVIKVWRAQQQATAARIIDCSPETDTNPTNSDHSITCTAQNVNGQTINAAGIDVEATGANDPDESNTPTSPDFSCTTAGNGSCSITHGPAGEGTTNEAGTTTYRAWIDEDGSNASSEADNAEGREEGAQPGSTADPEPDGTDVVEKEWRSTATTITMTPETDSATVGVCNPFTIVASDADGPVQGVTVDVEQRHETANDQITNNEPTVSFCTPTQGANPSSVDTTQGDLGPNSSAPDREEPDNPGTAGGETTDSSDENGQVTIGIAVAPGQGSNGSGNVTVTAWFDDNGNDDVDGTEPKDDSTKTWQASTARTIDCEPETATTPVSQDHTVTCTVEDAAGNPVGGQSVTFTETGPGEIASDAETTTNAQGQAAVVLSSDDSGDQTITGTITESTGNEPDVDECDRAAGDPSAGAPQGVCSDSVTNTWTGGADTCPGFANDDRNQIVGTPGDDVIDGTSGDDIICGLGGNDLIKGMGGDDVLLGGAGNDGLRGGAGNDEARGGRGKDALRGGSGSDLLVGGNGNDVISGNDGADTVVGNSGEDVLKGGKGPDEVRGGKHADTLVGGNGHDLLKGGRGKDTLRGNPGGDTLRGGRGADDLNGGSGNDRLNGGPGVDTCFGGAGNDQQFNCEG